MATGGAKQKTSLKSSQSPHNADDRFTLRNNIRVRVKQGDIIKFPFDAVVVGENRDFSGQGAIAKSLLRSGGPLYKGARDDMIREAKLPSKARSLVHVSSAGDKFKFKTVLHAIVGSPKNLQHDHWYQHLEEVFTEVGKMAEKNQIARVGTPLLGTGAARGDVDVSLQAVMSALSKLSPKHLEDVIIVEYELEKAVRLGEKLRDLFRMHPELLCDDGKEGRTREGAASPRPPSPRHQQATPSRDKKKSLAPANKPAGRNPNRRQLPNPPTDKSQRGNTMSSPAHSRRESESGTHDASSTPSPASKAASGQSRQRKDASTSSSPQAAPQGNSAASVSSPPVNSPSSSNKGTRQTPGAPTSRQTPGKTIPQHHNNSSKNAARSQAKGDATSSSKNQPGDAQGSKKYPRDSSNNTSSHKDTESSQTTPTAVDELINQMGSLAIGDKNERENSTAGNKSKNAAGSTGQNQPMVPSAPFSGFNPAPGHAGFPPQGPPYPQEWNGPYPNYPPWAPPPGCSPAPGQAGFQPQGPPYPQELNGPCPNYPPSSQPGQHNPQGYYWGQQPGNAAFLNPCQKPLDMSDAEWSKLLEVMFRATPYQAQPPSQAPYGWNPNLCLHGGQYQPQIPHQGYPENANQGHSAPHVQHYDGQQVHQGQNTGYGPGPQIPQPQHSFSGPGSRQRTPAEDPNVTSARAPLRDGKDGQGTFLQERRPTQPEAGRQAGGQGQGKQGLYPDLTGVDSHSNQLPVGSGVPMEGQGSEMQTTMSPRPKGDNFAPQVSDIPLTDKCAKSSEEHRSQTSHREPGPQVMGRGSHPSSSGDKMPRVDIPAGKIFLEDWRKSQSNPRNFPTWVQDHISGDYSEKLVNLNVERSHAEAELGHPPSPSQQPYSPQQSHSPQQFADLAEEQAGSQKQGHATTSSCPRAKSPMDESPSTKKSKENSEEEEEEETDSEPADDQEPEDQGQDENQAPRSHRSRSQSEPDEFSSWEHVEAESQEQGPPPKPRANSQHSSRESGERHSDEHEEGRPSSGNDPGAVVPPESYRSDESDHQALSEEEKPEEEEDPMKGEGTFTSSSMPADEKAEVENAEDSRRPTLAEKRSMPKGKILTSVKENIHLDGVKQQCGTIVIEYSFPNGIQEEGHPAPGQPYKGTFRRAFLPDHQEGRRVLDLLQKAFDRDLIFQLVQSGPDQEWEVEFADIPHKTSLRGGPERGGYPDPEYLPLVRAVLVSLGIE